MKNEGTSIRMQEGHQLQLVASEGALVNYPYTRMKRAMD